MTMPITANRFDGYAAVFSMPDSGGDVIMPGAFQKALARKQALPLLWQHDIKNPIGVIESIAEDTRGLKISGHFTTGAQIGSDANALVCDGALNGLSIGYRVRQFSLNRLRKIRILTELELVEISVVTFPMQPLARLMVQNPPTQTPTTGDQPQ